MLIDGHSMAFRAFYALPAENFSTTGGQHTNAVYGFLTMFTSLLVDESPDLIAVAFDVSRTTFRTQLYPEYKAQREATPPEFKGQVELIKQVLEAMGVTWVEKAEYEADDIIATLATQASAAGMDTHIVTGDRDSFQLVGDLVTVLYPNRGVSSLIHYTPDQVKKKYGLTPAQYPDFAALRGDPSDNLPKIPGVGEKTAAKWIIQYGSLSQLLERADEVSGKVGENLRAHLDQVKLNRELTQMVRDVELPVSVDELTRHDPDVTRIAVLFDSLQFGGNLRGKVLRALGVADGAREDRQPEVSVTVSRDSVATWLAGRTGGVAVAVDGNGTPAGGDCTFLGLVDEHYEAIGVDLSDLEDTDRQALAHWLASEQPKYFHHAKEAIHKLAGRGLALGGITHDTMIASYLLMPGQRTYALPDVYQRHLQKQLSMADGEEQPSQGQLSLLDATADTVIRRLITEAAAVIELVPRLSEELAAIDGYELYTDMEVALVPVLAQMESVGIAVDVAALTRQRDDFVALVAREEDLAREVAGDRSLNLSSPKQLQKVLFDTLDMPKTKRTKTGYSTAAKEIEALAKTHPHPFLDHLLAHREYAKMKTTLDGLLRAVGADGRIHTTFNQTIASTGRLSSTEPNLQNIPVRTPAGRDIRAAFVVGGDYDCLLTADYSQIEMRVMAHLSEDAGLIQAYRDGEDLHNYVGSQVFTVPIDEVTPELRRRVKAMSYGLAYGLSAFGLAAQLDIPQAEAQTIMDAYFERFGGVKQYLASVVTRARQDGYTATLFGRRRYLPELNSDNRIARDNAERAALNAPIQGTAADIIKVAMLRVDRALTGLQSRVLLQVHDELVVEVAAGELDAVQEIVEREMNGAISLRVPLEVSTGHGATWDAAAH
ncbi:MAG: DNA polymerase I [Corynebacterium sp.]|nr:DNA polymerase I [Corynebacterium sp.]